MQALESVALLPRASLRQACLGWYSTEDESKLRAVAWGTVGGGRERALSPVTLLSAGA